MKLHDGRLLLSPSDLANHLACPHTTTLALGVEEGRVRRPLFANPQRDLIAAKGDEHEAAFRAALAAQGREIVTVGLSDDGFAGAAQRTETALRGGADVVYQGCLASGGWRGFADFLVRLDEPSALGAFSYEAWDTKLARHAKPAAVLQLCFYSHELERIQGRLPERMHVVLGTGVVESFRPSEFSAYFRRARARLASAVAERPPTEPYRLDHCAICDFRPLCNDELDRVDHLVRVALIRRDQVERLRRAGIATLAALGEAPADTRVPRLPPQTFETLRRQAALQLEARRTGRHRYELLEPQPGRGLALLPRPSEGDLFFDIEGDPFWEPASGLEYLLGLVDRDGRFTGIWSHDRAAEKAAFERLVDLFHDRLARDPGMHVYHYAPYEPSALRRLAMEHATREDALDDLLRRRVFVDLYAVVRQGLRISYSSYSIKRVRELFMTAEEELDGGGATVLYERWRGERDPALLEEIRRYNEEDCVSNLRLSDWLVERKAEAETRFGVAIPWREPPEPREVREEAAEQIAERARLRDTLLATGDDALALAGHVLDYHRREAKPAWWAYFDRRERTPEELVEDAEAVGCLEPDGEEPVRLTRHSDGYGYRFPVQQHKLAVGDCPEDPATGKGAGEIVELDDVAGWLRLKRRRTRTDEPRALMPGRPYDTTPQREALTRLARSLVAGDGRYPHLERVLRRTPPLGGARVQRETLAEMREVVELVAGSYLFVQGPPGAGKTYTGARLVTHLLRRGRRVGITAQSHRAIHNLLDEVEATARAEGLVFCGLKKESDGNVESRYEGDFVSSSDDLADFLDPGVRLLAGTAWLFAREELDGSVDHLVVDEAGQVALADALAVGTAARTLVLLGDPVQLPQVTQGLHPAGAGLSVLEHLLDGAATVAEDRGLFLERSWRMHPDVCRFVSSAFYDERLEAAEPCARQGSSAGTGLRFLPVDHAGNATSSDEEADAIAAEVERLLGERWTDARGLERPLRRADLMVVAPYNAQVRALRDRLGPEVPVGTVDKFQGQQAPVVFFSMATSTGADAPRGIDFLMSRNRLNVAVSRAQCLAYLVCSPRLLDVDCRTIEHMRLANALCRFVELARQA